MKSVLAIAAALANLSAVSQVAKAGDALVPYIAPEHCGASINVPGHYLHLRGPVTIWSSL